MANRNKNTKYPYDPDPRMLRAIPAPEEPKHWGRGLGPRYCKKLNGPHHYDLDEKERNGGISYWSSIKSGGSSWRRYFMGEDEPLKPGEVITHVNVWLSYRCAGCGKKDYISYKTEL